MTSEGIFQLVSDSGVRVKVGASRLQYCERSLQEVLSKKRTVLCLWSDKRREVLS